MTPERKYNGDPKAAAGDVHVDFRTRNQHLSMIGFIRRTRGEDEAMRYWLTHCPRISKAAMLKAK